MKNTLIVLAILSVFACEKKKDPEPVTPDYADSLVGTYIGTEIQYAADNNTQQYNNSSKTMTVTKLGKNRIQVSQFNAGSTPIFNLSTRTDGNIVLSPEGLAEYSTGWNIYFLSTRQLNIYVKDGVPRYFRYQGDKQ
jgi:hypothetical protein